MLVESSYCKPFPSRFCQHDSGQIFPGKYLLSLSNWKPDDNLTLPQLPRKMDMKTWSCTDSIRHDPSIECLELGGGGILCLIDIHPLRLGNIAYTWHYSSWLCFSDCLKAANRFFAWKHGAKSGPLRCLETLWNGSAGFCPFRIKRIKRLSSSGPK